MTGLQPRPGVLDIARYVPGHVRLESAGRLVNLASNESSLGPSPRAVAAYREAAETLNRYPDADSVELREALARQHGIDAARIVCGTGSDELLGLLGRAYAGPGDEILFTEHCFAMYPIVTRTAGATPVIAPETELTADVDALLERVSERTRVVFLANPNNPTGTFLDRDEVRRLHAGLPPEALLVLDAAYAEFVARNDYDPGLGLVEAHDNVVMCRTFSKIYGLAGLRVGWAYCPPGVADVLNRVRNPFNVNAAALRAATAALEDVAHTDRARTLNDILLPWFAGECARLGLTVNPSIANFVLVRFPDEERRNAAAAYERLLSRGIIARRVANYGLPEWLRFSIGSEEEMRIVVEALADFLA
ncbi:MAG: histidinol-phosphate transaminase [Alphaproteobacteria bacterium]